VAGVLALLGYFIGTGNAIRHVKGRARARIKIAKRPPAWIRQRRNKECLVVFLIHHVRVYAPQQSHWSAGANAYGLTGAAVYNKCVDDEAMGHLLASSYCVVATAWSLKWSLGVQRPDARRGAPRGIGLTLACFSPASTVHLTTMGRCVMLSSRLRTDITTTVRPSRRLFALVVTPHGDTASLARSGLSRDAHGMSGRGSPVYALGVP